RDCDEPRAPARQDRLRRPDERAGLSAADRLSAVEVRERRVRPRARPPPARRGLTGEERPRPSWLFGHEPSDVRPDRSDEGTAPVRQHDLRPERRPRRVAAAARRNCAGRAGRRVLRSRRLQPAAWRARTGEAGLTRHRSRAWPAAVGGLGGADGSHVPAQPGRRVMLTRLNASWSPRTTLLLIS